MPKSNVEYWVSKIKRNVSRDEKNQKILQEQGWNVFIVWDCMTRNLQSLQQALSNFFKKIDR